MKKSYSFAEGVIHVSSLPRMRKFVLPILIIGLAGVLCYFKIKESSYANSLIDENIAFRNSLSSKADLIDRSRIISQAENLIKDSLQKGNKIDETNRRYY